MAEPFGRSMGAVGRREGIVDPDIAKRRKGVSEYGIVLFLAAVEPGIFETHDVAVLHGVHGSFGRRADAVLREPHRAVEDAGKRVGNGLEGVPGVALLRATEM